MNGAGVVVWRGGGDYLMGTDDAVSALAFHSEIILLLMITGVCTTSLYCFTNHLQLLRNSTAEYNDHKQYDRY
jgi:hypothetical protein